MKKALILMASIALATSSAHAVTAVTPTGGGITASDRSPFLNALGGTTAGKALFQMANPGAVRYLRINADNTVSALDAAAFLADIGGTGGGGATTWGSISGTLSAQTDLNSVLNGKQETLVSGTNIKTVNGSSLLGSGNIVIAGGGGTWGAITGTLSAQTDLNSALGLKAPLASPTFTGTVTAATIAATTTNATALSIGGVTITATGTELNFIDGVTSNVQTQLDSKVAFPSQTGNSGKFLTTNGTTTSWGTPAGSGDVTLTGTQTLTNKTLTSPVFVESVISSSAIDWAVGTTFTKTLAANTTFTFSNLADGKTINVAITNTASNYTVTWPTVKWSGGTAPTQTVGAKTDVYTFIQINGVVYGSAVQNF